MKLSLWVLTAVLYCLLGVVCAPHAAAAMDVTSLNGSYKIGELSNTLFKQPFEAPVYSVVGGNDIQVTFNGNGSCSLTYYWKEFDEAFAGEGPYTLYNSINIYGDLAPTAATSCSYTVDPEGAVTVSVGTAEGSMTISGWNVSANGETLLKSDVFSEPNNGPYTRHTARIMAGIKLGSGKNNAALAGRYVIAETDTTLYLPAGSTVRTRLGGDNIQADFDGAGNCAINAAWKEYEENYSGGQTSPLYDQVSEFIDPPWTSTSCTYSVADDGAMTLIIDGTDIIGGWHLSTNGNVLLKSSVATETYEQGTGYSAKIFVGIKLDETNSMDASKLNGIYKISNFESSLFKPTNSTVRSMIGGDDIRIYFDGSSSCSVRSASSDFQEGHIAGTSSILYNQVTLNANPVETPTCEYTVGAVGDLTLTINGTEIIGGWFVSQDGSMILKSEVAAETNDDNSGVRNTARLFVGTRLQDALPGTATGAYTLTDNLLTITWSESTIPCNAGPTPGSTENQSITSLTATSMTWVDGGNTMTWTRNSGTIGDITGVWFTVEPSTGNTYSAEFINNTVTVNSQISQCNTSRTQITGFSPAFGTVGSSVTIFGENFSHTMPGNYVWFNGAAATVTAASSNQITVTVPTGANNGRIYVSSLNGTAASIDSFTVGAGFVTYTSRVTDSAGLALTGVLVELLDTAISTTTDGNGSFTITVPSQTNVYLKMSLAGYLPAVSSAMTFSQDTDTSSRPFALFTSAEQTTWYAQAGVTKNPGTGIAYSRAVSARNPLFTLPGVALTATDGITNYPVCYTVSNTVSCSATTTEGNGKFYILNVPNGTQLTVTASKSGYSNGTKSYQVAADTVSEGRVSLATSTSSFVYTGKLLDSLTAPLSGASVSLHRDDNSTVGSTSTDSIGVFLAADMLAGTTHYYKFTKTDYLPMLSGNTSISADVDGTTRPFMIFPSNQFTAWGFDPAYAVISGSVKDSVTSANLAGATISAFDANAPATTFSVKYDNNTTGTDSVVGSTATATNTSGRFYVHNVPAGTKVAITATVSGYTGNTRYYHTAAGTLTQGSIFLTSATAVGNISASPASISFGNSQVGVAATERTITISNTGPGSITISASSMDGDIPQLSVQPGGATPCPQSQFFPVEFPSGQSCTLVVNFFPTSVGPKSANLYITSNAANLPTLTIPLSGNGVSTPGTPIINTITPGDGQAIISFTAPLSDGGSPIIDYTITYTPGNVVVTPVTNPATISGLSNNTQYTFALTARNLVGSSQPAFISATPSFAPLRVRSVGYATLQAAFSAVNIDAEIIAQAGDVPLTATPVTLNKGFTFSGGYLSDYSGISTFTTIPGRVNIAASSKVIFRNIKVK